MIITPELCGEAAAQPGASYWLPLLHPAAFGSARFIAISRRVNGKSWVSDLTYNRATGASETPAKLESSLSMTSQNSRSEEGFPLRPVPGGIRTYFQKAWCHGCHWTDAQTVPRELIPIFLSSPWRNNCVAKIRCGGLGDMKQTLWGHVEPSLIALLLRLDSSICFAMLLIGMNLS